MKRVVVQKSIARAVRRRISRTVRSLRWNGSSLIVACLGLLSTMLMALSSARLEFVAAVAVAGLATMWACSEWHVRKLQAEAYDEEMKAVIKMLSGDRHGPESARIHEVALIRPGRVLTRREAEVLCEAAAGKSNKEIAVAIGVAERTVKNHLGHAFRKLDVSDRTAAVLAAAAGGYLNKRVQSGHVTMGSR